MWSHMRHLRIPSAAAATAAVALLPAAKESHNPSRCGCKWFILSQPIECKTKAKKSVKAKTASMGDRPEPVVVKLSDVVHHQANGMSFNDVYDKGDLIGQGGFGKVFLAKHRSTQYEVAVKTMPRSIGNDEELFHEIDSLLKLDHPHIVSLIAYFLERQVVHLIFEVCRGPELYDRLTSLLDNGKVMPEWEVALVMRHMLKAVRGCHGHLMGHYDIKPENFMYQGKDLDNLKMIDLGASSGFKMNNFKGKAVGTPEYMAPEFHDGIYGPAGDIFSCGTVLFVLLTGELLWPDQLDMPSLGRLSKNRKWLRDRINTAQEKHAFSDEAKELLEEMLKIDRHRRISVHRALEHPFLSKAVGHEQYSLEEKKSANEVSHQSLEYFRSFSTFPILKRAARLILAHILPRFLARGQRIAFRSMDRDGYGELSPEAFENWYTKHGISIPDDVDKIITAVNISGNGYVNKTEWLAATLPTADTIQNPQNWKAVFNILDADGDGVISAQDLHKVFRSCSIASWKNALAEVCPDEAPLTWDRFAELMSSP